MTSTVKNYILEAVGSRFSKQGDSFRLRHKTKSDGSICTPETSDPALIVTRIAKGWIFFCHRCHISGCIYDSNLNPRETRKRLSSLGTTKKNKVTEKVELPFDFEAMGNGKKDDIPIRAYHWLWKYQIRGTDLQKYGIGWSEAYNRVIIPIFEFTKHKDCIRKNLVGWVGREVQYKSKAARKKAKVSKYITRSQKGKRRYFRTISRSDVIVVCEDIISAIKINIATGYESIALLNSNIGEDLRDTFMDKEVFIWLDADMLAESINKVNRLRQFGINAKHIHTQEDPKAYNMAFIRGTLNFERIKND